MFVPLLVGGHFIETQRKGGLYNAFFCCCNFQVFLVAAYSKPAEILQTPAVSNQVLSFSLFKEDGFFSPYVILAKCLEHQIIDNF